MLGQCCRLVQSPTTSYLIEEDHCVSHAIRIALSRLGAHCIPPSTPHLQLPHAFLRLLQWDESRRVSGADTWSTVLDRLAVFHVSFSVHQTKDTTSSAYYEILNSPK